LLKNGENRSVDPEIIWLQEIIKNIKRKKLMQAKHIAFSATFDEWAKLEIHLIGLNL